MPTLNQSPTTASSLYSRSISNGHWRKHLGDNVSTVTCSQDVSERKSIARTVRDRLEDFNVSFSSLFATTIRDHQTPVGTPRASERLGNRSSKIVSPVNLSYLNRWTRPTSPQASYHPPNSDCRVPLCVRTIRSRTYALCGSCLEF